MTSRHLFRASCATGAVMCGLLAVLTASAHAAGESTTATLTSPTSGSSAVFTWSYEFRPTDGGLPDLAVGFCDPGIAGDVELASQHYTMLPQGQGVTGHISVTFGHEYGIETILCTPAELPRTGSTG